MACFSRARIITLFPGRGTSDSNEGETLAGRGPPSHLGILGEAIDTAPFGVIVEGLDGSVIAANDRSGERTGA